MSKKHSIDIEHLWACKVLYFGMSHLFLSQLSSIISQSSADSKIKYIRKGARHQYIY